MSHDHLTERRKADREAIARLLVGLATELGAWAAVAPGIFSTRGITVRIKAARGLRLTVELDGASLQPDIHVLPWNIDPGSDARLVASFGNINPHHRMKATQVAHGTDALLANVRRGLTMARDGSAFEGEAPKNPDASKPVRNLTCCCCGASTRGRQWWNRDTGFGLCVGCIEYCSRNETPDQVESLYGVRGIHYDVKE